MYSDFSYLTKKDQQVPTFASTPSSSTPPTPSDNGDQRVILLEEILTHEQNTCIEIRDTCTIMAQSVKDVLGSACPKGGYVQNMKEKLGQLEKAVTALETTIKRKSVFDSDFLDNASQRWFEKRLNSTSRKRRLRNFKRRTSSPRTDSSSPTPKDEPATPTQFTFMSYDDQRYDIPSTPSTPSPSSPLTPPPLSPPSMPLPALTIPSNSNSHSPRSSPPPITIMTPSLTAPSPSGRVPSTPSYPNGSSVPSTPSYPGAPTPSSSRSVPSTPFSVPSTPSYAMPIPLRASQEPSILLYKSEALYYESMNFTGTNKAAQNNQSMSIANIIN